MTGDTAQEALAAFLASVDARQASRDREAHMTAVERRMLTEARRRNHAP